MKRKILIYDFDGTLTTTPHPSYKIMSKLGYDNEKFKKLMSKYYIDNELGFYTSYFNAYFAMFSECGEIPNVKNICYGSDEIQYLNGVCEYLHKYVMCDHYVVTSGFDVFVKSSDIAKYFKNIYGTSIKFDNDVAYDVDYLLSDKAKPDIIKKIVENENASGEDVMYLGDGLTDRYAMEYVKSIGGKSIYIVHNDDDLNEGKEFLDKGIVDKYFYGDYSSGSDLERYICDFVNEKN